MLRRLHIGIILLLLGVPCFAWAEDLRALSLKGAYLYNISKFVYWPSEQQGALHLCVWGDAPLQGVMAKMLTGKRVAGRGVTVVGEQASSKVCQLLYLGEGWQGDATTLQALNHKGLVTVSDHPDFLALGGIVQLVEQQNRLKFRIHQGHAEAMSVQFAAKLMQLALEIVP
ncbi:hypothetical protein Mmc1_2371 [Magnetococcus marinus MC-1]|uniref:Transmembrane protein n=1 Tax=Magnetococcus marinus (strain ATCC BAA-1437 / JCM 17883 / MC-1) TaxID=156889 RepID=A0LA78_MAGMM|nr:YfiR family protein [Magnetococcus marinus]ABK44871.1 hypothetical protein Mmc1_2371 [Magnetococcus marinus MC-1]